MAHVRKQIRDTLATLLTGLATTGANVFKSRNIELQDQELPGLIISTGEEQIDALGSFQNLNLQRNLTVRVVGKAKVAINVDDTLDQIAAEVETKIQTNVRLNNLCTDLILTAVNVPINEDTEAQIGEIELIYQTTYLTQAGAPETSL